METLPDYLQHWASETPGAVFLRRPEGGAELSYAAAAARVGAVRAAFRRHGVAPGDRVALLAENGPGWVLTWLAALAHGAVIAPLHPRLAKAELAPILDDLEPALVVADAAGRGRLPDGFAGRVVAAEEVAAGGGAAEGADARPAALGSIAYTSGTAGEPKGVKLSQRALAAASLTYARLFGSGPGMRTAVVVPLCHNTGFIDGLGHALVAGGCLDLYPRFRAEPLARAILAGTYSFTILVPTMYARMAAALGDVAPSRAAPWLAYGGAPMPAAVAERFARLLPAARLVNCYGLSEATSITHYLPWRPGRRAYDAIGVAVPGTADRLGPDGELQVDTPTVMAGYWRRPAATRAKFDGRWLRTGDLATRGADGLLRLLGRADEVINRGGEKFAPIEVEHALTAHPDIVEAAVVGLPDADLGQVAAAAVVRRQGREVAADALLGFLSERLAGYKLPGRIVFLSTLPRNPNGKILRPAVRRVLTAAPCREEPE